MHARHLKLNDFYFPADGYLFNSGFLRESGSVRWVHFETVCMCTELAYCTSSHVLTLDLSSRLILAVGRRTNWLTDGWVRWSLSPLSVRSIRLWSGTPAVEGMPDTYKSVHFKASFHHLNATLQPDRRYSVRIDTVLAAELFGEYWGMQDYTMNSRVFL